MPYRPPRHNAAIPRRRAPGPEPRPAIRQHTHRAKTAARGYGGAWQRARLGYLARHPLCVHCLAKGIVTASNEVDHIVPHRGDRVLFWDSDNNWQALCAPCHSVKTAAEDGGFGNRRKDDDG